MEDLGRHLLVFDPDSNANTLVHRTQRTYLSLLSFLFDAWATFHNEKNQKLKGIKAKLSYEFRPIVRSTYSTKRRRQDNVRLY